MMKVPPFSLHSIRMGKCFVLADENDKGNILKSSYCAKNLSRYKIYIIKKKMHF